MTAPRPVDRQHLSAIHVLKGKLQLDDDAYRDLLQQLTGKRSSAAMSLAERQQVRAHLQHLAERSGVVENATAKAARGGDATRPASSGFAAAYAAAHPRERKVWALWGALHRAGLVNDGSAPALHAWVQRTVQVSAPRFCTTAQLDTCIEALKDWLKRAPGAAPAATQPRRRPRG